MRKINFSGLAFELGQTKTGLVSSPEKASEYFYMLSHLGLSIQERGSIFQPAYTHQLKFFTEEDLLQISWNHYQLAYEKTLKLLDEDELLLNWGGDHSLALSTVGAFTYKFPNGYVLWIDAHADLNLPSHSLSGNLHGMPMSFLLNLNNVSSINFKWVSHYLNPEKVIYVGLRDLDLFEKSTIESLKIKAFTREKVREIGIENVVAEILSIVGHDPVHVSFDIDSVDPKIAPSTGVPVSDGLNEDELMIMANHLSQLNLKSIDMVELNPFLGSTLEVDQTFIVAMNFLKTLLAHPGSSNESMGQRNETNHSIEMEWAL